MTSLTFTSMENLDLCVEVLGSLCFFSSESGEEGLSSSLPSVPDYVDACATMYPGIFPAPYPLVLEELLLRKGFLDESCDGPSL